jgi:hypothetical protein
MVHPRVHPTGHWHLRSEIGGLPTSRVPNPPTRNRPDLPIVEQGADHRLHQNPLLILPQKTACNENKERIGTKAEHIEEPSYDATASRRRRIRRHFGLHYDGLGLECCDRLRISLRAQPFGADKARRVLPQSTFCFWDEI